MNSRVVVRQLLQARRLATRRARCVKWWGQSRPSALLKAPQGMFVEAQVQRVFLLQPVIQLPAQRRFDVPQPLFQSRLPDFAAVLDRVLAGQAAYVGREP